MSITLKFDGKEKELKFSTFSGGEEQVQILPDRITGYKESRGEKVSCVHVQAYLKSSKEVMDLVMLVDAIRRLPSISRNTDFTLTLPYIPYARQDRVMNYGESLAVKVFADIINNLNFDTVFVHDPHSDVSAALLNNVSIYHQHELFIRQFGYHADMRNTVIVAPDAGARKKAAKIAEVYGLPLIEATKTRDVTNNRISGTDIHGDVDGKICFMVDDLCDYGGTFKALGKVLKEKGASKVLLWVTHGIFAAGADTFEGTVDEVYAYHPWEENLEGKNELGIFSKTD